MPSPVSPAAPASNTGFAAQTPTKSSGAKNAESPTMSEQKSIYLQSRLKKMQQQKREAEERLTQVKQKADSTHSSLTKLHKDQDRSKHCLIHVEQELEQLRTKIEELEKLQTWMQAKEIQGAIEALVKLRVRKNEQAQKIRCSINFRKPQIQRWGDLVLRQEATVEEVGKKVAVFGDVSVIAARQADILDLKPFELRKLSAYAASDAEFSNGLTCIVQSTTTEEVWRYVKSVLFDQMTGVSKQELQGLVTLVRSAKHDPSNYAMDTRSDQRGDKQLELVTQGEDLVSPNGESEEATESEDADENASSMEEDGENSDDESSESMESSTSSEDAKTGDFNIGLRQMPWGRPNYAGWNTISNSDLDSDLSYEFPRTLPQTKVRSGAIFKPAKDSDARPTKRRRIETPKYVFTKLLKTPTPPPPWKLEK